MLTGALFRACNGVLMVVNVFDVKDSMAGTEFKVMVAYLLCAAGDIVSLSLDGVVASEVCDDVVVRAGRPLAVHADPGDYLMVVARGVQATASGKVTMFRMLLLDSEGHGVRPFSGYYGNLEGDPAGSCWRFPAVSAVMSMFADVSGTQDMPPFYGPVSGQKLQ